VPLSQHNMNQGETKSSTQETQLSSQQKELAMREKELEAKIKLDQRNIWLASPLLIGCVSAVAGLIGTVIGAILQGNATYNLERQKFEYSLIQNALKAPNQEDAAKQLVFLVDTGVIKSLDGNRLRNIAKTNPGDIPYNPGTFEERVKSGLFNGRVGRIKITNGTSDVICIKLYHPDDPHRIFSKQAIPMRDTIFLTGGPYGSDWGIQVNESKINIIGKIASWNNVDNIFSYEYKPADVTTSYSNAGCN
jgi:hypothetical protein